MIFQQIYEGRSRHSALKRVLEIHTNDIDNLKEGTIKFLLKDSVHCTFKESPEIPISMLFMIMDVMSTSLEVYGEQLEATLKRMKEEKKQNGKED